MEKIRELLQEHRVVLCERIEFSNLLWDQLIQNKVISLEQKEFIKVSMYFITVQILVNETSVEL